MKMKLELFACIFYSSFGKEYNSKLQFKVYKVLGMKLVFLFLFPNCRRMNSKRSNKN